MLVELVLTDWSSRVDALAWPMRLIADRLREGPPPSAELAEAIEELRKLSPTKLRHRIQWLMSLAGDLHFEACVSLFWAGIRDENRRAAEAHLEAVLGPDFVERLAKRSLAPDGEARTAAMQAAYEVVVTAAERGDQARNQRAVFRTSVKREARLRLTDAAPHKAAPDRVAREAASTEVLLPPAAARRGDPEKSTRRPPGAESLTSPTMPSDSILEANEEARAEEHGSQKIEEKFTEWGLTPKERALALALALGGPPDRVRTLAEAARDLEIAESTARVHAMNIRRKIKAAGL